MKSNIQNIDQINNKTKNITLAGRSLKYEAYRTFVASKGRYKITKINNLSIIIESRIEKHVINTYLKMKIPTMWIKFFKNFAENKDYKYDHCNNRFERFNRYCVDWYMYNVIKNGTVTNDVYVFLNNFSNQNIRF